TSCIIPKLIMAVDLSPKKDGGILKEILREGQGQATPGDSCTVYVHYHGTLTDGTVFDSSRERDTEFNFVLGMGQVIKAWDIGVASMKRGELCRLTCAPEYAYGENGSPPKIPPNSTLVFEVELLRWSYADISPEKDGSLTRRVITKGELYTTPTDLTECTAHIRGTYEDGKVFDERDVTFVVGEAVLQNVCRGIEIAVREMKKGEKAEIFMKGKYVQDACLPKDQKELSYVITLHNFEKAKDYWELNSDEKIASAEKDKAKGTEHFKAGRLEQALKYYKRVQDFLKSETTLKDEAKTKRDALYIAGLLNIALVQLKRDENLACIEACDEILAIDEKNVKALFRRGQARLTINEFDTAMADFNSCLKVEPENKAALSQLQLAKAKQRAQLEKEKKMYKAMFQKMAAGSGEGENGKPKPTEEGVWSNEQDANSADLAKPAEAPVEAN
ncbi:peptidyl-prolyl cis-trans isomerase FKBP4-like, partial [Tropilaelaps mercedesae]